jgi:hypothetical protein
MNHEKAYQILTNLFKNKEYIDFDKLYDFTIEPTSKDELKKYIIKSLEAEAKNAAIPLEEKRRDDTPISDYYIKAKLTAKYNKPIPFLTKYLVSLPGVCDEHKRLTLNSKSVIKLAQDISKNGLYKNPIVSVNHRGEIDIWEGNHRIRAQQLLGKKYTPVEFRYYNGGENTIHPLDMIKKSKSS